LRFGQFFQTTYYPELDGEIGSYFRFLVDCAVASEGLGFDSVWGNEHHFRAYGGFLPSMPVFLSAIAQRTSTLRLGTSVVVLPLHHPIELAEQLAMVDLMSNGRLEVGVGRGNTALDFRALGISTDEALDRTTEGLELLTKAWGQEPFSHHGKHFHIDDVDVWPKPRQQPHPPLWMACSRTPASFEWAGRGGYGLLTIGHVNSIDRLAELTASYRQAWAAAGRDPSACRIATFFNVVVAETSRQARDLARGMLIRFNALGHGVPTTREYENDDIDALIDDDRVVAGDPAECAAALARVQDRVGLTDAGCKFVFGGISREDAQRSMRLFAEQVIPRLKDRQPRRSPAPRRSDSEPADD